MKSYCFVLFVLMGINNSSAQKLITATVDRTTNLVFSSPIIHADRGTKDILVQIVPESEKVIMVKAACRNFHPTSLSVLTGDGNLYTFIVNYDSLPSVLVYSIFPVGTVGTDQYAISIVNRPSVLHGIKDRSWGIHSKLSGIYVRDSLLFFQLQLENRSTILYDIEQFRFYIRDKKNSKRTTEQEIELQPICRKGFYSKIAARDVLQVAVAFGKFTLPNAKTFIIEITERNGGRNLRMKVNNRKLMKAIPLTDLIN